MRVTEEMLRLTVDATLRAIRTHGAQGHAMPPLAAARRRDRLALQERAHALLLRCAITQLHLRQTRAPAAPTPPALPCTAPQYASAP